MGAVSIICPSEGLYVSEIYDLFIMN